MAAADLRTLRFYSRFRGVPMPILSFFLRQPIRYFAGLITIMLLTAIAWRYFEPSCGLVLAGILLGAIARDIGQAIRARRFWPTLDRVLDWKAVDALLVSGEPNSGVGV